MTERKNGRFTAEEGPAQGNRDWSPTPKRMEPEAIALSRILGAFRFPASKEEITRKLAIEAFAHDGGRAADLHDLVVQLEPQEFPDLESLRKAIREYHAWEKAHDVLI